MYDSLEVVKKSIQFFSIAALVSAGFRVNSVRVG